MTEKSNRILIFEDRQENREDLHARLETLLSDGDFSVECYDDSVEAQNEPSPAKWLRDNVRGFLTSGTHALLAVVDWDLTMMAHAVQREMIQGLCEEEAIAVCGYVNQSDINALMRWRENHISLDTTMDIPQVSENAASIAKGFARILEACREKDDDEELGDVVHHLLKPPESASAQVEQYFGGDMAGLQITDSETDPARRAMLHVGYWIYNRLLRFPGPVLNAMAAASYLQIHPKEFERSEVRGVFDFAMYGGPFAGTGPYWWTDELDAFLSENTPTDRDDVISGREWAALDLGEEIQIVQCPGSEGPHDGAGFYCILSKAPVCSAHSESPGPWLPAGADRCRIHTAKFRKLGPWLQL